MWKWVRCLRMLNVFIQLNLGKVLLSPDNQRAKRAVNMIKEFARHHMKMEQVKLEEDISHLLLVQRH